MNSKPSPVMLTNAGGWVRLLYAAQFVFILYLSSAVCGSPLVGGAAWLLLLSLYLAVKLHPVRREYLLARRGFLLFTLLVIFLSACMLLLGLYPSTSAAGQPQLRLLACAAVMVWQITRAEPGSRCQRGFFLRMLAAWALLFWLWHRVLPWQASLGYGIFTIVLLFSGRRRSGVRLEAQSAYSSVTSCKLYYMMTACTYTALFSSGLLYAGYMLDNPALSPGYAVLSVLLWAAVVTVVYCLLRWLFRRRSWHMGLGSFLSGAVLLAVAFWGSLGRATRLPGLTWSILWAMGLALMYSATADLRRLMEHVIRLTLPGDSFNLSHFRAAESGMQSAALLTACAIFLCAQAAEQALLMSHTSSLARIQLSLSIVLPVFFLILGVVFCLLQPLDYRNKLRMEYYFRNQSNDQQRQKLRDTLNAKTIRRYGIHLLIALFRPFLRYRTEGAENINEDDFPAVFICNHDGPYGPIAAILNLPTFFRPWVYAPDLDRSLVAGELYEKHFSHFTRLSEKAARRIAGIVAGPVHWALTSFDPIPVWRESGKAILRTLSETIRAMEQGDNILLFPESRKLTEDGMFVANDVGGFYSGFPVIAQHYTAKTGKPCSFYPCYADRTNRVFRIGPPLTYMTSTDRSRRKTEREEIARELRQAMEELCHGSSHTRPS